jgi:hypothetical protein
VIALATTSFLAERGGIGALLIALVELRRAMIVVDTLLQIPLATRLPQLVPPAYENGAKNSGRGADAVHLASARALLIRRRLSEAEGEAELVFACNDEPLRRAAHADGFRLEW